MEGVVRREQRALEVAIAQAWHTENFRRTGKKLRNLDHYLKKLHIDPKRQQSSEEVLAVFQSLVVRGAAVTIRQREK